MSANAATTLPRPDLTWFIVLLAGIGLALLYVALPYGPYAGALYVLATFVSAAVVGAAAWRRRDAFSAPACAYIALALAVAGTGHAIWYILDWLGRDPFPSIADAFYLAVYPLFVLALRVIDRHRPAKEGAFSDALIVGISAAVIGWALLIRPYVYDASLTWLQLLVATAYPVADLMLLPFVLRLVFETRARASVPSLILAGLLAYLGADMLYAYGNATGWYAPGGATDGLWLVAYALFAAAAWHPGSSTGSLEDASRTVPPEVRVLALGGTSAFLPTVILVMAGRDEATVRVAAVGSILVFMLVVYRLYRLVRMTSRQQAMLEVLSQTDALTGAVNRRYLNQVLDREIARCERTRADLSVAFLDLDYFKTFNDTYGHDRGDRLLTEAVQAWRQELRPTDVLARLGGDEFIVVLPDSDSRQCQAIVERLRGLVPYGQTCSAGVARFRPGDTLQSLIARADDAVYRAKRRGRDQAATANQ